MPRGTIHVVATLNVTQGTGELRHVTPVAAVPPGQGVLASGRPRRTRAGAAVGPSIQLRLFGKGDAPIAEFVAPFIADACRDAGDDVTGTIDAFVPGAAAATRLELVLDGAVVDTFAAGAAPAAVSNIRGSAPARSRRGGPSRAAARTETPDSGEDADPVLSWTPAKPAARAARSAARGAARTTAGGAATPDTRYTVQVSIDGGATWQTVGYALREPQVRIDRGVLGDAATVKVRVTATSGFTSVSTEKTMKASELG